MRVAALGVGDAAFLAELGERTNDVTLGEPLSGTDALFLNIDDADDVRRLSELRRQIKPNGAVWAVFRKGRRDPSADLRTGFNQSDVPRLGLESGLVDVKVVRFSDTHTALKFVIRKTDR